MPPVRGHKQLPPAAGWDVIGRSAKDDEPALHLKIYKGKSACLALVEEHALRLRVLCQDAGQKASIGAPHINNPAMLIPVVIRHSCLQPCMRTPALLLPEA